MKKNMLAIMLMLFVSIALNAAPADDSVSEINEDGRQFRQGQYKAGTDAQAEPAPDATKGAGFDEIAAPEILIKGKVDTRILAVRELSSLYDMEKVRGVLYERNKVELPGGLDDEAGLSPLAEGITAERDSAFWLKLFGGTANTFLAEGLYGRAFGEKNSLVLNAGHESFDNPRLNGMDTRRMMNFFSAYYGASHGPLTAFYSLKSGFDSYGNPYAGNLFGARNDMAYADIKGRFGYGFEGIDYTATLSYSYLNSYAKGSGIYLQSSPGIDIRAKKDFSLQEKGKASAFASVYWQGGVYDSMGAQRDGNYTLKLSAYGSYFGEAYMIKAGIDAVSFFFGESVFRVAPKVHVSYEPLSFMTIYGQFSPETSAPELLETIKEMPFTAVPVIVKGIFDDIDARAGIGINAFETFMDAYAGVKKTVIRTVNTASVQGICTLTDSPAAYSYFGASVTTLRARGFTAKAGYEYRLKDTADYGAPLMLALQKVYSAVSFEASGFKIEINAAGETGKDAAPGIKIPAFLDLGAGITYDINGNISVFGRVNNLLNNPEYMVYYYKNKGLNLGLGALINF